MQRYKVGVDLGGTKTAIAVLNSENEAVFLKRCPTPAHEYRQIVSCIVDLVGQAQHKIGFVAETSIGVGIPGSLEPGGVLVKNANTQVLIGEPLGRDLQEALGVEVVVANDANCFAASEATDGAAAGADIVFGVILGTGVGGAIAISGRPVSGANGIAGEWGHNPFPNYGRTATNHRCYCGKTDCIETVLSGPALARDFCVATGENLTAEAVAERAEAGDKAARRVIEAYAKNLARALSTVINLLDPDIIVLGGGVSNIETLYLEVPRHWDQFIFNTAPDPTPARTKLVRNKWGDDSGVRGAAWLTGDL